MRIAREEFERLVTEALAGLPAEFREKLENVEVLVEDRPPADFSSPYLPPGAVPLAIYEGVPLTERSTWSAPVLPARIVIYQGEIERHWQKPADIIREVRRSVLHEIGHHFGISDRRLRELGL